MKRNNSGIIEKLRRQINESRPVNQDIIKITVFFSALFMALIVYMCIFLGKDASSVINNSYNRRSDEAKKSVERGAVYSADGDVLAYTETDDSGNETRIYPYNELFAHVVGFESNGGMGLESSYNYYLLTSHDGIFTKLSNELKGKKSRGDSIVTTLDTDIQKKAYELLDGNYGAVICMDPSTGEILADVSEPGYDPNNIEKLWESIVEDESNTSLLNRPTQGLYTPGDAFELFTVYEYIKENGSLPEDYGSFTETIDINRFSETLDELLFDKDLDADIASNKSIIKLSECTSDADIAELLAGQGQTLCSPLHLAMVYGAAANNGICVTPHLVSSVNNADGKAVETFRTTEYGRLFSSKDSALLKQYLNTEALNGTEALFASDKYEVYGRSGTAEAIDDDGNAFEHSWFVGWAESGDKKVLICAIVENKDIAGIESADIGRDIFDFYFD